MLRVLDLNEMKAFPYEQRERNVFYQSQEFKIRIVELPPGGEMPTCEMASHVIFHVLELKEKQCLITGPATLSMITENGSLIRNPLI
jgi:hypothetical protein